MNKESFFTVVHKLTATGILTLLLCCSSIKEANYGRNFDIDNDDDRTRVYEALDIANSPSKAQLSTMETEAKLVMGTILNILENGKCYKALVDDIDENQEALEKWVERTKESQEKIGLLIKGHPNIYCISLVLRNFPVKEEQMHVRKNFKQIKIMWIVPPNSNRCLLIVFPSDSCMSFYGETLSEKENAIEVAIRNIPSHFIVVERKGQYPNFLEETRKEENKKSILETIIDSFSMISVPAEGSKGLLISFREKVKHKGHRFWADGIGVYFTYNYNASKGESVVPECPKNVYGKPIDTCLMFPLKAN